MTRRSGNLWRIGTTPFLSARPLDAGLQDRADVRLVRAPPSRLTTLMENDGLDAALLPAIDYFRLTADAHERHRHRPLVIVPDIALAGRGPVADAVLFCRTDYGVMRHVALDPNSRTANCLVRLILKELYDCTPHFRWPVPDGHALDAESDALLLIGDPALSHDTRDYYRVLDLGEAWHRYARLPFVYALWVAREADDLHHLTALLTQAKARGLASRDELARRAAVAIGISDQHARTLLYENVYYDLGPDEIAGLQKFYRWAADQELAPLHIPIRLVRPGPDAAGGDDPLP